MRLYERLHTKIQVPLHKDVLLQSFMQHCKLKASNGAQSREYAPKGDVNFLARRTVTCSAACCECAQHAIDAGVSLWRIRCWAKGGVGHVLDEDPGRPQHVHAWQQADQRPAADGNVQSPAPAAAR